MTRPRQAPNDALLHLWHSMKPKERQRFVKMAKTSVNSMRQLIGGRRGITVDFAARIEHAALRMGMVVPRGMLSPICGGCPYALACGGLEGGEVA